MIKLLSPCKGCDKRQAGCHSTCEAYLEWQRARDEALAKDRAVHCGVVYITDKEREQNGRL